MEAEQYICTFTNEYPDNDPYEITICLDKKMFDYCNQKGNTDYNCFNLSYNGNILIGGTYEDMIIGNYFLTDFIKTKLSTDIIYFINKTQNEYTEKYLKKIIEKKIDDCNKNDDIENSKEDIIENDCNSEDYKELFTKLNNKSGRIRSNLMGKRTNFNGRSVAGPN